MSGAPRRRGHGDGDLRARRRRFLTIVIIDFPICRFEHCNIVANKVTHELARLARFQLPVDWFEEPLDH